MARTVHSVNLGFDSERVTVVRATLPSSDLLEIKVGSVSINITGDREDIEAQLISMGQQVAVAMVESKRATVREEASRRVHGEPVSA